MFRQAANSPTKFDAGNEEGGENSVRPLKGKGAQQAPKMIILTKVDELCSDKREEPVEPLTKDDTDVMWNEFLRFR